MPTGYTAYIEDGDITTGKEFLMLCSRAFGVAATIRDKPLPVPTPTHFEPDPYYKKRYVDAVKALHGVKNMSLEDARVRMRQEHNKRVDSAKWQIQKMEEINQKYKKVRSEVEAWVPPTKGHDWIKRFALEQIDMCIEDPEMFELYSEQLAEDLDESDEAVRKYLDELIRYYEEDVTHTKKSYDAEVKQTESKNKFMRLFLDSLDVLE